jgi:hypothetical protein
MILTALSSHKYLRSIIIDFLYRHSSEGRNPVGFRKLVFRMPDQVRHDGEFWTVKIMMITCGYHHNNRKKSFDF